MVRSRLGLKILGLSALVFGLMAFIVSAAQAETGAKWAIVKANGELVTIAEKTAGEPKGIGHTLLPSVTVKEIETLNDATDPGKHLVLHTKIIGVSVLILCTGANLLNAKLVLNGGVSGGGSVIFTGCVLKLNGVTSPPCKPHSTGKPEGTIETLKGKGLMRLHNGTPFTMIESEAEKELFVTIVLGTEGESECSIGEFMPVSGKLALKDAALTTETADHLIEEFLPLTDLWVLNKTVEHKAEILGSAIVSLSGEHAGLKWAGLPA